MSDAQPGGQRWIDAVADRFERAWRAGRRPQIEDELAGAPQARRAALLEELVRAHLRQHGGDTERSLAAVSSIGSARRDLAAIADPDLQASLPLVASARRDDDPDATRLHASGASSSVGERFRILRFHAK